MLAAMVIPSISVAASLGRLVRRDLRPKPDTFSHVADTIAESEKVRDVVGAEADNVYDLFIRRKG